MSVNATHHDDARVVDPIRPQLTGPEILQHAGRDSGDP